MSGKERPRNVIDALAHRHFCQSVNGDGAKTEFDIGGTVYRTEDIVVFKDRLLQRVADRGTANDYSVRGLTTGYNGESNTIKFAAAPGAGVHVDILRVGG